MRVRDSGSSDSRPDARNRSSRSAGASSGTVMVRSSVMASPVIASPVIASPVTASLVIGRQVSLSWPAKTSPRGHPQARGRSAGHIGRAYWPGILAGHIEWAYRVGRAPERQHHDARRAGRRTLGHRPPSRHDQGGGDHHGHPDHRADRGRDRHHRLAPGEDGPAAGRNVDLAAGGVTLRSASADDDGFVLVVETPAGTQIWRLAPDGERLRTIDVVAE